jgi:hypothetical protein
MLKSCFGNGWNHWEVASREMILVLGMIKIGLAVDQLGSSLAMEVVIPRHRGT